MMTQEEKDILQKYNVWHYIVGDSNFDEKNNMSCSGCYNCSGCGCESGGCDVDYRHNILGRGFEIQGSCSGCGGCHSCSAPQ